LILSSDKYPSSLNEKTQYKTWAHNLNEDSLAIFYKGGSSNGLEDNYLTLEIGDSLQEIGYKTIAAMDWLIENYSFDYLIRSNSSTYININEMKKYILETATSEPFYSGRITTFENSFKYAHGSCIILNNLAVFKILENRTIWDHMLIDDAALGKLFNFLDIELIQKEVKHVDSEILTGHLDKNYVAYRCKMELSGYPRFLDRYFITATHELLSNKNIDKKLIIYKIVFNVFRKMNFKYLYITYFNKFYYKITSTIPDGIKRKIKKNTRSKNFY
tara:strand:- start:694 stop:1515 length:822 start_codon:yes stop_codon:yes gene_type:complete